MAITKLNSLAIPDNTIVEADLSYPLTNFSSTGIDDNATSNAITIDSSQNVTVNNGNLVIGTNGKGIDFSASSGSGSTSELLDDYEEGTWTPTVTVTEGPAAGASPSYSGTYTKIGNRVYATATINLGNSSDAFAVDDRLSCGGLPFTSQRSIISGVGTGWTYASFGAGNNCFWHVGIGNSSSWWVYCTHLDGGVAGNKIIELEFSYPTGQ